MRTFVLSACCALLLGMTPLHGAATPSEQGQPILGGAEAPQLPKEAGATQLPEKAEAPQLPETQPPSTTPDEIPVSIDRVKDEMARIARRARLAQSVSQAAVQEGLTFKVKVEGYSYDLPDFWSTLVFPKEPVMFGGTAQADLMRTMVPESVRGGALYSNSELAMVMAQSFASAFAVKGLNAARHAVRDAIRSAEESRIHREVLRQLLQIEENRKKREEEAKKKQLEER